MEKLCHLLHRLMQEKSMQFNTLRKVLSQDYFVSSTTPQNFAEELIAKLLANFYLFNWSHFISLNDLI